MTTAEPARPLRVLHRSYAGDGAKPRPPYFSKLLALASLVRAARALPVPAELVFLNDGPMPAERLRVMEEFGEVRAVRRGGSDARSYREMLADEAARSGPDDGLVWLAEDDYLYLEDGLVRLVEGAAALPQADYFMIYGSKAVDTRRSTARNLVYLPDGGADHPDSAVTEVAGSTWYRIGSTTSTFGLRRRALVEDVRVLRYGALTGGSWDSSSCRMVQGYRAYARGVVPADLFPFGRLPAGQWPKSVARGLVRAGALAVSRRPAHRRRVFMGIDPEHAFHMEAGDVPPHPLTRRTSKIDWAEVAAESAAWARDHGIPVELPDAR